MLELFAGIIQEGRHHIGMHIAVKTTYRNSVHHWMVSQNINVMNHSLARNFHQIFPTASHKRT